MAGVATGADSATVMTALGPPDSVEVRGHPFDSAGLRVWYFRDLVVEFAGHVERITLRTPAVATARGVRIGDPAERVRTAYGEPGGTATLWSFANEDDPSGLPPAVELRMLDGRVTGISLGLTGYDNAGLPPWQWARPPAGSRQP